jgi:2,3-bisphosphoglycerate-dependent phosphoglycerate mutase
MSLWCVCAKDPDLTAQGIQECQHAAALMLAEGYEPDLVYTSRLKRSIRSARIVLQELQSLFLPVQKSWRLNERCYGALTGLSKSDTAETMGASVVQAWRNSLKARPPPMSKDDPYYPGHDRRYADLSAGQIPLTESLLDTMKRTRPLFEYRIKRDLMEGNTVLVVAHGNTLRGLIKVIDDVSDYDIQQVNIPAGIPIVYNFDRTMRPLPAGKRLSQEHTNAVFLEKPGLLQEALQRQNLRRQKVPGLEERNFRQYVSRDRSLVAALERLRDAQSAQMSVADGDVKRFDPRGDESLVRQSNHLQQLRAHEPWDDDPSEFEDWDEFSLASFDEPTTPIFNRVTITLKGDGSDDGDVQSPGGGGNPATPLTRDPVVVFIRHGRTPHNNLGLFTGWEDPPLAPEGIEDARRAGRILKHHGFEFDVVYTSWLTRAIETASVVLDELDCIWVTVVKSWRLNERMCKSNFGTDVSNLSPSHEW